MSAIRSDRHASRSRGTSPDVLVRPGGGRCAWRRGACTPGTRRSHDGGRGRRSRMPRDEGMAVACGDGTVPSRWSPTGWPSELINVKSPHPIPHQRPRTGKGEWGLEGMSEALTSDRSTLDGTSGNGPGRHSPHLKTGRVKALVGSNPTPSAFARDLPGLSWTTRLSVAVLRLARDPTSG